MFRSMGSKSGNLSSNLSKWKFLLMIIITILSWGFAFPFIKIGLKELSPINLTIMRFFIVCMVFAAILAIKHKNFSTIYGKDIPKIFILGFFGIMVYHLGLNYGEQYISPSTASLIIATIPVFTVVLAAIFLDEAITWKKLFGVILALFGVITISIWGKPSASLEIKYVSGALVILLSAIMASFYTVAGKRMLKRYSALSLTVYAMLFGSLGLLPFLNGSIVEEVTKMSSISWIAVIFLGIFSTVIGYSLWYAILKIRDASEVSAYLYCIPVVTILIDLFIFKEKITLLFILGGILIIIGLIIVNKK